MIDFTYDWKLNWQLASDASCYERRVRPRGRIRHAADELIRQFIDACFAERMRKSARGSVAALQHFGLPSSSGT
jgi:hypothetical protein